MTESSCNFFAPVDVNLHADFMKDESGLYGNAEYIAFPENVSDIKKILSLCAEKKIECIPQGARTNITGGAIPEGGCVINFSKMKKIGEICKNGEGYYMESEPGALLEEICAKAAQDRLEFAPDPSETSASIGGLFSTNAKGGNSVKYGSVGENILAVDMLLPSGEEWHIERGGSVFDDDGITLTNGKRVLMQVCQDASTGVLSAHPGMDLLDYLSGSGGVFGIITKLRLKLIPKREPGWAVIFFFDDFERAVGFCEKINSDRELTSGRIEKLEILDKSSLDLIDSMRETSSDLKAVSKFEDRWNAAVIVQLTGGEETEEGLMGLLGLFDETGQKEEDTWAFEGEREIRKVSAIRHAVSEGVINKANVIRQTYSKAHVISSDFSVPPEKLSEICGYYHATLAEGKLDGAVFGHASAARIHGVIFPKSEEEMRSALYTVEKWAEFVLEAGGKLFEENGIGETNKELFLKKMPEEQFKLMKAVKCAMTGVNI